VSAVIFVLPTVIDSMEKELKEICTDEFCKVNWKATEVELNTALAKQEEIQAQLTEAENTLKDQTEKYQEALEIFKTQIDELTAKRKELEEQINSDIDRELQSHYNALEELTNSKKFLDDRRLDFEKNKTEQETRLSDLNELQERLATNNNKLGALKNDYSQYALIQRAFNRDGIPALLLENALPQIASTTNEMLTEFGTGQQIRFDTIRDKADGKGQIETFDIMVIDEIDEKPLKVLSGGEKPPVIMAMQAAIGLYRAQQSGFKPRFAIVDECDGAMRDHRAESLIEALRRRMDLAELNLLLLVTHRRMLADQCEQRIILDVDAGKMVEIYG
jgi:DNA repair protein SbcC/Rad50